MIAIAYCVSPDALLAADRARSYPTIPLAQNIAHLGESGLPVVAAGLFVALLAVTGACFGVLESLADRVARIWNARTRRRSTVETPDTRARQVAQAAVLAVATGAAVTLASLPSNLQFSDILSVAGFAGGGMLLLVLPLFLPTGGRQHSRRVDIAWATITTILLAVGAWLSTPPHLDQGPVNAVIGGIFIAILGGFCIIFVCLLFGEPSRLRARQGKRSTSLAMTKLAYNFRSAVRCEDQCAIPACVEKKGLHTMQPPSDHSRVNDARVRRLPLRRLHPSRSAQGSSFPDLSYMAAWLERGTMVP